VTHRWIIACVPLAACAEWPRYRHLPGDDPDLVAASTDPRDLVEVVWNAPIDEAPVDNDSPIDAQRGSLASHVGYEILGVLEGTGWSDTAVAPTIENPECGPRTGDRSPLPAGDYVGDVDFYVFDVAVDGLLCTRIVGPRADFGWDLLVFRVDECGIPEDPIETAEGTLGVNLGGESGGWGADMTAGRYAVMFASYDPNDAAARVAYDLGVSLSNPVGAGDPVCPRLPAEEGT
jgi:hypothetical protein